MTPDEKIVSSLKEIEYEFHALKCMAGILASVLEESIGKSSRYDKFGRISISEEEIDRLCFVWNEVSNRANRLERDFMKRIYPEAA